MAINLLRAFFLVAAGSTAAVGTAYVSGALDPYLSVGRAAVAPTPAPAVSAKTERLSQQPSAMQPDETLPAAVEQKPASQVSSPTEQKPASQTQAKVEPAQQPATPSPKSPNSQAEAPAVVAPSFDIVRVETDGSIVVAGKAAPEATVEIVAGAQVLGTTTAGTDGDFAIALDEQLKPGGHELVLRSTAKDNVVATSPETAVVSIPEQKDGQVLALVEKPGEPSKLITVPKPEPVPSQRDNAPAAQGGKPAASSSFPVETKAPAIEQPTTPGATAEQPTVAGAEASATGHTASKPAAASTSQPGAAAEPRIAVDAVEIEGRKVFVAGAADAGRKVRVYANDILLGEAPASPGGRFLIETERDLPVGDYIIRADALEPDSDNVVARAAVPFEREAGNAVAAVAPEGPSVAKPAAPAQPTGPASSTTSTSSQPSPPAAEAPSKPAEPSEARATTPPPAAAPAAPAKTAVAAPTAPAKTAAEPAASAKTAAEPAAGGASSSASGETAPALAGKVAAITPETSASKLENVDGAVIIRRGDTLWRISKRVYGHGVRYSTIYLANQDQISDPNRIWPGQIFHVPGQTSQGEAADMTAVKDQAAKVKPTTAQ